MRAMILAAGRGERLRPLTDSLPKPLVEVGGKPLIEWHLENLARSGYREIVINQGHLGDMLPRTLGNGDRWGVTIHWSDEQPEALDTGGGIFKALPLLGGAPFLIVNGDVWTDYPFSRLRSVKCDQAHLVMVENPRHNMRGDFSLRAGRLSAEGPELLTYSGIAVYHPRFFESAPGGKFSVVPFLLDAMKAGAVTGERYRGDWSDIGTIDRLESLRQRLSAP